MAISRMQNPQQLQGIGSLRQPYGLGKLVKKAFRGVKKIAKSPLGKAAILGGLGMWGMGAGGFGGLKGAGWLRGLGAKSMMGQGPLAGTSAGKGFFGRLLGGTGKFFKTGMGKYLNPMSGAFGQKNKWKHAAGLLGAGAIAAPFIQKAMGYGPYQEEEEAGPDWSVTPSSIQNIIMQARAQDPSLSFLPASNYAQSGFYGAGGGLVGLANGGNPGEAQMEQMLRAEYMKYRNQGGTMPYEQFKILVMKQAQQGQTPNQMMAAGGRAGYLDGELVEQETDFIEGPQGTEEFQETVVEGEEQPSREQLEALAMKIFNLPVDELDDQQLLVVYQEAMQGRPMEEAVQEEDVQFAARGGRMGFFEGALADTAEGKAMSPGTSARGGTHEGGYGRDDVPLGNTGGNNQPIVNPVGPNYPAVGTMFNTALVNKQIAYDKFMKQYEDDENKDVATNTNTNVEVPTSGYENLDVTGRAQKNALAARNAIADIVANNQDIFKAQGGRVGYQEGELVTDASMMAATPTGMMEENVEEVQGEPTREELEILAMEIFQLPLEELDEQQLMIVYKAAMQQEPMEEAVQEEDVQFAAQGGRMGFQMGGSDDDEDELTYNPYRAMDMYKRTRRQEGGLMDLQGQEKDYRENGGFVDLGGEERADDVPARLSKNEFVFTADAVRAAGGGDIDAGSEVMQNVMDNLEQGGEVSEDSQGLQGGEEIMSEEVIDESNPAQGMYDNYEQLQSRVA